MASELRSLFSPYPGRSSYAQKSDLLLAHAEAMPRAGGPASGCGGTTRPRRAAVARSRSSAAPRAFTPRRPPLRGSRSPITTTPSSRRYPRDCRRRARPRMSGVHPDHSPRPAVRRPMARRRTSSWRRRRSRACSSGRPARAGSRADCRTRARLRRGSAPLPGRRPRRDRNLDGAQPPDRSVLVTPLQPAARRLRREPREPDALRCEVLSEIRRRVGVTSSWAPHLGDEFTRGGLTAADMAEIARRLAVSGLIDFPVDHRRRRPHL